MSLSCRSCGAELKHTFVDLGTSPLANSYLRLADLTRSEAFHPLCVYVCNLCFLVQLEPVTTPEDIFSDYAYFSSFSDSWLDHAKSYVESVISRFKLDKESYVIEIASNDGYLLQYFVQKGIPVLGIEPAKNVAEAAKQRGIPTLNRFFRQDLARDLTRQGKRADLLVGNNVLAHVPDLIGFIKAMKTLLADQGIITLEFPHLLCLMQENQFDTIYHEHLSYFSLLTLKKLFQRQGLTVFDVEELPTHGGSLRVYARHEENNAYPVTERVPALISREKSAGLADLRTYLRFGERVKETKRKVLKFLIDAKEHGKSVAGYGAPAKGNTLLNYCGIRTDLIDYTVDRSPHKQGRFLPGTRIPIYHPDRVKETNPDYVLILPWNLNREIMEQMSYIRSWGGRFVVPIPEIRIL
jgi:SAM-dependent methyltransferase